MAKKKQTKAQKVSTVIPAPTRIKRKKVKQHYAGPDGKKFRVHVANTDQLVSSRLIELLRPLDLTEDADFSDFQAIAGWLRREGMFLVEFNRALNAIPNMHHTGGPPAHIVRREAIMHVLRALLVQDDQTIEDMNAIGELNLDGAGTFERIIKYMIARIETSGGDKK